MIFAGDPRAALPHLPGEHERPRLDGDAEPRAAVRGALQSRWAAAVAEGSRRFARAGK